MLMKTKHLLLTLLLALMVPLATLAQVERTVTVNNGTDKYHRVPAYGGREINQWYRNEFVIDKAYLQEMAGKQIIKMELYVAQPVPSSYMATSGSYAVRIREKDWATSGSYSSDSPAFRINPITTLEDQQRNGSFDFDGKGNIVVRFSSSFLYSGENNLVVQFESEKHNWLVSPFGIDNLPLYYGVNHTGYALEYCNTEQENTYLNGGVVFAKNQVRNFAPKVTFTYLDEATWANTNKPQNPVATALSSSSIRLSWEAGDYTGSNYQVLCVERGTTPNWSNAVTVSNTYYTFENLASNTTYDLYVRARTTVIVTYNSKAASATATTQHGGNLDEGPIAFDFGEGTHPNGLTVTGNDTHLVTYGGCLSYSGENTVTVTLPRLHFTNATNGLMLEFNMYQPQGSQNPVLVELVDEYQGETPFSQSISCNSYQSFSFRLKDGLAVSSVMLHNCYKIRFTATGPFSLYNINVRKLANVIPASDLAATDVTTTSAQINWIDDNTNSHTLQLYYRTKGYHNGEQGHWQGYVPVTGTSHILTGLTPYTEYEVMVKTIYGSDFENSATLTFGTLCPEQTVPYEQDFTGLDALPQYWRIEGETNSTTYRYYVDDEGITFTSSISGNWVSERNAYIILPYFRNLASLQFSFENRGGGGYVTVGVMTDPFDVSSFRSREYVGNSLGTHNINFGDNWASDIQYGHIALQVNKGYYDGSVQVDNFVVTRLAVPTGLTVSNVTNTTATLGWNAGAATEWEVQYKQTTASTWTSVTPNPTSNSCTLTGLTASTDYVAQVRAKYGDGLYSDWVSFEGFKTYYSAPISVDENDPYSFGFQRLFSTNLVLSDGGWQLINKGLWGNNWKIGAAPGTLSGIGNDGTNYSLHISYNGSDYQYVHRGNDNYGQTHSYASTVYATRVFTLAPGSYQFSYRWKCKGIQQSDYFRVALVPANTVLTANDDVPDELSYNKLPAGWIALDGGEALNPISANYGFASYTTPDADRIPILGGDYMMVFVWHNDGTAIPAAVNPPVAIDNVGISCTALVYPPDANLVAGGTTDTEASMDIIAPSSGLAPTGYEVQYIPNVDYVSNNNNYGNAPIATFNAAGAATLTGLAPLTAYTVRIRSVYTANGKTVYSDWQDYGAMFTTAAPRPTNLAVVNQTTSRAHVIWTDVQLTLPEGQRRNYTYQLTTDPDDWGADNPGLSSNGWERNLAPGSYHFRVKTAIYDNSTNTIVGESNWSEPIQFTIAPWTDPVTLFPLTYGFETPTYFDDGLTLGGALERLKIYDYSNDYDQLPAHAGGESQRLLGFTSGSSGEAYLVMPAIAPSSGTMNALVSFWWYHDNTEANPNGVGVTIEYSTDGTNWTAEAGGMIKRHAAETGWVKYQRKVFVYTKTYIRLRFTGAAAQQYWKRCYMDDLNVDIFKSYAPYIAEVACEGNTANITLHDYAIEHDLYSTEMEVQYREYREPGQPEEEWTTYPAFALEAPYTFENTLSVNGLNPNTTYEFRARARASMPMPDGYGNYSAPWSDYSEAYIGVTGCGYTITPSYSYTEDFEELFNGTDCWTGDIDETAWQVTTEDAHSGTSSFYIDYNTSGTSQKELITPPIDLTQLHASSDNVILRFWVKYTSESHQANLVSSSKVNVYNGSSTVYTLCNIPLNTDGWIPIELSLSKQMGNVVTIGFKTATKSHIEWYIDDIEIIANPYPGVKILDLGGYNYSSQWNYNDHWYPTGAPTASDDAMVLEGDPTLPDASYNAQVKSVVIGQGGAISSPSVASSLTVLEGVEVNCLRTDPHGNPTSAISIGANTTFSAGSVTLQTRSPLQVSGTANITTLNPGAANSVVVKNGGTLYAGSITGTSSTVNNTVVVEDGGQLKLDNLAYATIKKSIGSYTAIEQQYGVEKGGYYLISSPLYSDFYNLALAGACTFVEEESGEIVNTYDLYEFNYEQDLEWRNYKEHAFLMERCKGALYANRDGVELSFAGPVGANNTTVYANSSYSQGGTYNFNGWKLLGNPFPCNAYITDVSAPDAMSFYRMNESGTGFIAATGAIAPMEGIFVHATMSGQGFGFTRNEPTQGNQRLGINLKKGNVLVDNAIIRFSEGGELPKFSFSDNTSKVYFPMKDKDYAVMHSQPVGELPLNFEAAADGTYTLSFDNAAEDLVYCHLIDNLTGADVDLLSPNHEAVIAGADPQSPAHSYTFTAKKTDYASRFRVVFAAKGAGEDACEPSFAFNNNGNWIILNEGRATLQVIDLNGRILSSEQIEGSVQTSIHQPAGLYLIRLLNGNDVKIQKVIVK